MNIEHYSPLRSPLSAVDRIIGDTFPRWLEQLASDAYGADKDDAAAENLAWAFHQERRLPLKDIDDFLQKRNIGMWATIQFPNSETPHSVLILEASSCYGQFFYQEIAPFEPAEQLLSPEFDMSDKYHDLTTAIMLSVARSNKAASPKLTQLMERRFYLTGHINSIMAEELLRQLGMQVYLVLDHTRRPKKMICSGNDLLPDNLGRDDNRLA